MPPADPAALARALRIVRCRDEDVRHVHVREYDDACELLAREFGRLADAGELVRVRVRGLEWKVENCAFKATTPIGTAIVWLSQGHQGWCWAFNTGAPPFENHRCDSREDAMAACDAHYRTRLAAALEPLLPSAAK